MPLHDHRFIPTTANGSATNIDDPSWTTMQCDCGAIRAFGPANDSDPNVQIEIRAARAADSDAAWESYEWVEECHAGWPWDPNRPLREQWPWSGDPCPGTDMSYIVRSRPIEIPILTGAEPEIGIEVDVYAEAALEDAISEAVVQSAEERS